MTRLDAAADWFRERASESSHPVSREDLWHPGFWWFLAYPFRRILNLVRRTWRLEPIEVCFLNQVFNSTIAFLASAIKPDVSVLAKVRLDLHYCWLTIAKKLDGLPEIERANNIEHFCQAFHTPGVTLEEVVGKPFAIPSKIPGVV